MGETAGVRALEGERVCLDARRHGIVLARPLTQAVALAAAGVVLVAAGWPVSPAGALALGFAAAVGVAAVWRWERHRLVITDHRVVVVEGILRRRTAAVRRARMSSLEVRQSVPGRLLDYGTLVAGDLVVPYVPRPGEVSELLR